MSPVTSLRPGNDAGMDQAVQEYLDALLHEPAPVTAAPSVATVLSAAIARVQVEEQDETLPDSDALMAYNGTSAGRKPVIIPRSEVMPPPAPPAREFAEPPPRVLPNLRMPPAPPVAPAALPVQVPVPARAPVSEPVVPPVDVPVVEAVPEPQRPVRRPWADNGRPHWAQDRFDCLMFRVSGLTLAVPLVDLGTIQQLTDQLTPIFGQVDWMMGLLPVNGASIRTVDTARVVMPERYTPELQQQYQYVVTLFGSHWGLAADSVAEAVNLAPDQVKWRSQRSRRPWLAGTVVEHMCALLDVDALRELLDQADRHLKR